MLTPVVAEDGQVGDAVAVEVGHADDLGGARGLDGDGVGEAAASQAGEHAERVRAGVDRHQVGRPARRERPGGHARRRLQAGDLGRAGAGVDRGQTRSRRDRARAGAKVPSPRLRRMLTWPVSLLVTTRSSLPLPVRIDRLDVRDAQADGDGHWRGRSGASLDCGRADRELVAEEDRERAVAGVADDQVGQAVAVEVGRDDLRRQPAGGERTDLHEAAVAVGVERDRVVVGVDTGEHRALIRVRNPGDVARGDRRG